jgi:histo-blood group ABO system transferase
MGYNIGLMVVATGRYKDFFFDLLEGVNKHFFLEDNVTLYLFTDDPHYFFRKNSDWLMKKKRKAVTVIMLLAKHEPWPMPTLKRYHLFCGHKEALREEDYLFYVDVDMKFVGDVGREILPEDDQTLVGTIHPGYSKRCMFTDVESCPASTAHVSSIDVIQAVQEGRYYCAGGFNGGSAEAFLDMAMTIRKKVDRDLGEGIVAVWHDESHMNRYFIKSKMKYLPLTYCFPENWEVEGVEDSNKKILALDKNHEELRREGD